MGFPPLNPSHIFLSTATFAKYPVTSLCLAIIPIATPEQAPSQRQLRAGELMRHALAEILARGEVHDPVIETHLITVPRCA